MKMLIAYTYHELFEETLDESAWRCQKTYIDCSEILTNDYIVHWKTRLKDADTYRGISLVLFELSADGTPSVSKVYQEMLPPKKRLVINPLATEKNQQKVKIKTSVHAAEVPTWNLAPLGLHDSVIYMDES